MGDLLNSKVLLPISPALKATYNTPENESLFEGDNLRLFCEPSNYTPEFTYGDNNLIKGFNSYTVQVNKPLYTINLKVIDARDAIRRILDSLIADATANPTLYQQITLLDFHNVNASDIGTGYTTRQGTLTYEISGGSHRNNGTIYNTDLSIRFVQLN